MRKLLLLLAAVIVVVIVAALALPYLIPTETYKAEIAARVEAATGRRLQIDGPLRLSLLPRLALEAEEVRIANVEGGSAADVARFRRTTLDLRILPLLRGAVEVERFVLVEPEIHLEIDAEGRPNWQLGGPSGETPAAAPPAAGGDVATGRGRAAGGEGIGLPLADVSLGDVRLEGGSVTFSDRRSGVDERVDALDLQLALPDLRGPLTVEGSLAFRDETVELDLAVERVQELLQGKGSPISAQLAADPLQLAFEGRIDGLADPRAQGVLDLEVAIRRLAAWLGTPLEVPGEGLQHLRVSGQLEGSARGADFVGAAIELDEITAAGQLAVDLRGEVPAITGRLEVGAMDLNPYLSAKEAGGWPKVDRPTSPGDASGAETARGDGGWPKVDRPASPGGGAGAETGGGTAGDRAGGVSRQAAGSRWSDEPIPVPPLDVVDADLELVVESLAVQDLRLGRTEMDLRLAGRRLVAELKQIELYGGAGSGRLEVDVTDGEPRVTEQFQLAGLRALPFLTAAMGFERVEGTASLGVALTTHGGTQRQLIGNLQGDGRVLVENGAIVGINLAAMVRNVAAAFRGAPMGEVQKTDFGELSGSFTIDDGVLSNDDMQLLAPLLRLGGAGQVDLREQRVDYRIEPKAVATLEGQGGRRDLSGLMVPVIVEGPWDDLSYRPDLAAVTRDVLDDPERLGRLADQVREIDRDDLKDAARDLLGIGKEQGQEEGAKPENPVRNLLKGLFGND